MSTDVGWAVLVWLDWENDAISVGTSSRLYSGEGILVLEGEESWVGSKGGTTKEERGWGHSHLDTHAHTTRTQTYIASSLRTELPNSSAWGIGHTTPPACSS
jgi:hypothetical protein